jgi:hypothetical protein
MIDIKESEMVVNHLINSDISMDDWATLRMWGADDSLILLAAVDKKYRQNIFVDYDSDSLEVFCDRNKKSVALAKEILSDKRVKKAFGDVFADCFAAEKEFVLESLKNPPLKVADWIDLRKNGADAKILLVALTDEEEYNNMLRMQDLGYLYNENKGNVIWAEKMLADDDIKQSFDKMYAKFSIFEKEAVMKRLKEVDIEPIAMEKLETKGGGRNFIFLAALNRGKLYSMLHSQKRNFGDCVYASELQWAEEMLADKDIANLFAKKYSDNNFDMKRRVIESLDKFDGKEHFLPLSVLIEEGADDEHILLAIIDEMKVLQGDISNKHYVNTCSVNYTRVFWAKEMLFDKDVKKAFETNRNRLLKSEREDLCCIVSNADIYEFYEHSCLSPKKGKSEIYAFLAMIDKQACKDMLVEMYEDYYPAKIYYIPKDKQYYYEVESVRRYVNTQYRRQLRLVSKLMESYGYLLFSKLRDLGHRDINDYKFVSEFSNDCFRWFWKTTDRVFYLDLELMENKIKIETDKKEKQKLSEAVGDYFIKQIKTGNHDYILGNTKYDYVNKLLRLVELSDLEWHMSSDMIFSWAGSVLNRDKRVLRAMQVKNAQLNPIKGVDERVRAYFVNDKLHDR